jgi:PAS domain S-box-containing protein
MGEGRQAVDVTTDQTAWASVRELDGGYDRLSLRESEGRYQRLVDHSPDAILVNVGGTCAFANQAAARLLGAESCNEVVGKSIADLIHSDDRELAAQWTDEGIDGEGTPPRQIRVLRLDGIAVQVEATGAGVQFDGKPAVQLVMRDITERKQAEAALRETNEYLDNLFNYANAPIIVWDPESRITRFNRAFEVLTGRQSETVIGESLEILFPEKEVAGSMELIHKTLTGERWETVEIPILHLDGSVRTVLWNSATLFAPDGVTPVATIAQGQDITERKQAEERIRKGLVDLERSNQDLEQFAYVASHDLQEPLRMVASYTALLAQRYEGQLDDKAQTYIHYAVDGATRMQRLINDLLSYSRVSTQARPPEPVDSHAVLGEALRNLTVAIEESRAIVSNDDLPTVLADAPQLVQVFQNLIANAIKFRGQASPHVHVSARKEGGVWLFSVADNGIGIDSPHAERLFVIFQRLHTRQEYPGTGIGLAVCKRIVERHGGKIWFESKSGKGSTFFFTLPA